MSTEHPDEATDNPDVAHEHSDINVRGVFWFVTILIVAAVVIHVAMWGLLKVFESRTARHDPPLPPLSRGQGPHLPPPPRLQTTPVEDLKRFRAGDEAQLSGYSWVDRQAGVVRIPIDRAKRLYAERAQAAGAPAAAARARSDERSRDTASGRFVK